MFFLRAPPVERFPVTFGPLTLQRARNGPGQFHREDGIAAHGGGAFQGFGLEFLGLAFGPPLAEERIGLVVRDAVQPRANRAGSSSLRRFWYAFKKTS
jgi:hypothetical protein